MVNKVCVCVNTQRMCSIKHEIEKLEEIFLLRFPLHFLLLSCQESQSPLLKVHVVALCYMLEVILLKCKMNKNKSFTDFSANTHTRYAALGNA